MNSSFYLMDNEVCDVHVCDVHFFWAAVGVGNCNEGGSKCFP